MFFLVIAVAVIAGQIPSQAQLTTYVDGRVVDAVTGDSLASVSVLATAAALTKQVTATSDSTGGFRLGLSQGSWHLSVDRMGYRSWRETVVVDDESVELLIQLSPHPLQMDPLLIKADRDASGELTTAFVHSLDAQAVGGTGEGVTEIVERAVGARVRRYGGLGSFSTISIRGSTSEQVLVYLDGVPLNRASGGGVDLGALSLAGVESVDVYRGAVPARFGGNSLGGVVHLRTVEGTGSNLQWEAGLGSFQTRQLSVTLRGNRRWVLAAGSVASDNDFLFLDDNGTEYNLLDDEKTERINSDFQSSRLLTKADVPIWGATISAHNTFDISHRGIPGLGNFQSRHTRFDTWQNLTELLLSGRWGDGAGYRVVAYHSLHQEEYKDLHDEVGFGVQHDHNQGRTLGSRAELSILKATTLVTVFFGLRRESFNPDNLIEDVQSRLRSSRRVGTATGAEAEVPLGPVWVQLGGQVELLDDKVINDRSAGPDDKPVRRDRRGLWGSRLGARYQVASHLQLKGHIGRYSRSPSFFELFGDKGAVIGDTELEPESGISSDLGLEMKFFNGPVQRLELVAYRNRVTGQIRFVHNSQLVLRPLNIGQARLQGLECRLQASPLTQTTATASYTYSQAVNSTPGSHERGLDLPNSPRHVARLEFATAFSLFTARYELSAESRHFLDRANLRPAPRRRVHTASLAAALFGSVRLRVEARNLTGNQMADLWGYPLPGRSLFHSLRKN
ncbi:MAG: TonB-dependent receptor [Candidatus Latescibacterota bacterium]|nr:TonB-dependent receptor [Candidatus Latescibacterota bacterium]